MNVFVSWTSADKDVKNVIAERIKMENHMCFDSDEFCTSEYSTECIQAIKNSQVFIVILSDESMKKGYVLNEVITARKQEDAGKLNILIYKITDSPLTDAFEFQLNHISFVSGNCIQRKETKNGESSIDQLINRVNKLIQKRTDGEPEKPFDVDRPIIDGLTITTPNFFVENSRNSIIEAIEEGFNKSNVIVLEELFGYGKRAAIKKYVELHKKEYTTKTLVTNSYNTLREFFSAGISFSNINEKVFEMLEGDKLLDEVFKKLQKLTSSDLLVITDVKYEADVDENIYERLASLDCHIILVTQESTNHIKNIFPVINVGRMENEHLFELFFHHYDYASDLEKEELEKPLLAFFDNIGGHTKTIELTASVLSDAGIYAEDVQNYLSINSNDDIHLSERIEKQIFSLFNIKDLSEEEVTALTVASLLAVPYIPETEFRMILADCGVQKWEVVSNLDKRGWLDIDKQNRVVSIEPLISQIVISNNSENYGIFSKCARHFENDLTNVYKYQLENNSVIHRLEHLFIQTGLKEFADLITCFKKQLVSPSESKTEISEAISRFEQKYPNSYEPMFALLDSDEEFDEEEEITEENVIYLDTREGFIATSINVINYILPSLKIFVNPFSSLAFDIKSIQGSKLFDSPELQTENILGVLEKTVGLSREEIISILEGYKEMDLDEEDNTLAFIFNTNLIMYAIAMKDLSSLTDHINDSFEALRKPNSIPKEYIASFIQIFNIVLSSLIKNKASIVALKLCKEFLSIDIDCPERTLIVYSYINALSQNKEYTDELYEYYDECIKNYDSTIGTGIDKRSVLLQQKKDFVLCYAEDLICGERFDDAIKQFTNAQKINKSSCIDRTVSCANNIINALIRSGEFEEAVEFAENNLPSSLIQEYKKGCSENTLDILYNISEITDQSGIDLQSFKLDHPLQHVNTYQDYSKDHNSFNDKRYNKIATEALEYDFSLLSDEEIKLHSEILKQKAKNYNKLDIASEAFALASEAGFRVLGYRHHFVQYLGAAVMADGKIAEMMNGEGKTYTIVLTAFLNYLYGRKVFIIDESKYRTVRNHEWMRGVFELLGVSSMHYLNYRDDKITNENGEQYDVIYTTIENVIFKYLTDESSCTVSTLPSFDCAILDEADTILVDTAKQTYSSVGIENDPFTLELHNKAYSIAQKIGYNDSYYSYENNKVILKSDSIALIEKEMSFSYNEIDKMEYIQEFEKLLKIAIQCCVHWEIGKDYYIHNGTPVTEDKRTGRFTTYSKTYEYFIRRKNNLDIKNISKSILEKTITNNIVCLRDFFKKFSMICGTTATAVSFKNELKEIYDLDYALIPTVFPCKRIDYTSPVYLKKSKKDREIIELIKKKHAQRTPILLITDSIEDSERFSNMLYIAEIEHKVLNAKNEDVAEDIITLAGIPGSVLISTALANRGVDIKLGGNPEQKTRKELVNLGVDVTGLDELLYSTRKSNDQNNELAQKYYSILEKNKRIAANDRAEAEKAGGLCVIISSFVQEPRVEQQARGRSGRQGNVGESWIFYSIEDEGIKLFLRNNPILERLCNQLDEDEAFNISILKKSISNAQKALHNAVYADIRSCNDYTYNIDIARKDIIQKKIDILQGKITVDDFLKSWASDKSIADGLKKLNKGEEYKNSDLLIDLFNKNKDLLRGVSGKKAEAVLLDLLKEKTKAKYNREVFYNDDFSKYKIASILCDIWSDYIQLINNTHSSFTNPKEMTKYAETAKEKALLAVVERFLL